MSEKLIKMCLRLFLTILDSNVSHEPDMLGTLGGREMLKNISYSVSQKRV